jgi:hypothetical protein
VGDGVDYVRVYMTIVDDPKFVGIFTDDHHFATWVRLLMVADAAWPASAMIPRSARQESLDALVEHDLIAVTGDLFRVVGLDAERGRRKGSPQQIEAGRKRAAGAARVGGRFLPRDGATSDATSDATSAPPADYTSAPPAPHQPIAKPSQDLAENEPSQDEQSSTPAPARQKDPYLPDFDSDRDALDLYHELTLYRPWGLFSGDKLRGAIVEYGNDEVEASMRAEHSASADRETLLSRTLTRLARDAERKRITKQQAPKPRAKDIEQIDEAERSRILREFMEAEPWPSTPDAPSGSTSDSASEPETTTASTDT